MTKEPGPVSAVASPAPIPVWIRRITRPPEHFRTALRWTLLLSMTLHLSVTPFARDVLDASRVSAGAEESTSDYQKKIESKQAAKLIAPTLSKRITMPPPPADPETVIGNTFTQSVVSDVAKTTKGVLDVKLQKSLLDHVASSLKDEIAAAAGQAAEGKLSREEIETLQREFKKKALTEAVRWRKKDIEERQTEIAQMSTTEWYERTLSAKLVGNMRRKLYSSSWSCKLWRNHYSGVYTGWNYRLNWSLTRSARYLDEKLGGLAGLIKGLSTKELTEAHRSSILRKLRRLHSGSVLKNGTYPKPSWRAVVRGGPDKHEISGVPHVCHMTDGIINEFRPERAAGKQAIAGSLDGLWARILATVQELESMGRTGASSSPEKDGTVARLVKDLKKVRAEAGRLRPAQRVQRETISALVRVRVLVSKVRDEMHAWLLQSLESALTPMIQQMLENEFDKGIVVHKDGVTAARREFMEVVLPLLRRDLLKVFPMSEFKRRIFDQPYARGYRSRETFEPRNWPSPEDVKADLKKLETMLSSNPELSAYAQMREKRMTGHFKKALRAVNRELMNALLGGEILMKDYRAIVEGVDYHDRVGAQFEARKLAWEGRGQDLASLTTEGVPDTSAPLIALLSGAPKGHGASLEPFATSLQPGFVPRNLPALMLRSSLPTFPPEPGKQGLGAAQTEIKPGFKSSRFETIPFLAKFPVLDGDLSEWARLRPLQLVRSRGSHGNKSILFYAAWSYQGFFFAYEVKGQDEFIWPTFSYGKLNAFGGDHCRLFIDTLDARLPTRGDPHTQEFVIFPRGTELEEHTPGAERRFASRRDAKSKEWRKAKATVRAFSSQPADLPDGTGPFRVTRVTRGGYVMEVFIPRNIIKVPVFAPGWHIGFNTVVAAGRKGSSQWAWSTSRSLDNPRAWGDLLLLGTDARVYVQDTSGTRSRGITPGHSYLLTVIDPDRNVNVRARDTVVVTAEVVSSAMGTSATNASGGKSEREGHGFGDVEVFVLKETEKNNGVFRGFIDTQPGRGREVRGVLECLAGEELRLGYVDFGDARGRRRTVREVRLPVVAGFMRSFASARR